MKVETVSRGGSEGRKAKAQVAGDLSLDFDRVALGDFEHAASLEWIEANGLGGWASSTVSGAHTRRYHGLLVAATRPPAGRRVLLSRLEETVVLGGDRIELGANRFPGAVHPRGFDNLVAFSREDFPSSLYAVSGLRLRKTTGAISGENTTVMVYEIFDPDGAAVGEGSGGAVLELRPLFAGRDIHSLGRAEPGRTWAAVDVASPAIRFSAGKDETDVYIEVAGGEFRSAGSWYYNFEYSEERERGFDFREDLFQAGVFTVHLEVGRPVGVVISSEPRPGRSAERLLALELERRERLVRLAGPESGFARRLALAADQFLVRRGVPEENRSTIIAGYPWFPDWGRDAMIALPGLCLETGRYSTAREILRAFGAAASEGMLPNRFPEAGEDPEYNTVDATLWLFVAVDRYRKATGDDEFVRGEMLPLFDDILSWHGRGTRFGIGVGGDGLLRAGSPGVQLTWMDAKVGDDVVTPRHGKPVEIEALWYNALRITAALHRRFGDAERSAMLGKLAGVVRDRFEAEFWNEAAGGLFDVVSEAGIDSTCRPNQIYALSLPHPLLPRDKAAAVLSTVEARLLTPRGLRSLAPGEPGYCPQYSGDPERRDRAYHQGTVWSFLLGAYIDALVRYRGSAGRRQGRQLLTGFAPHLREAGVGTISEIFDADPPHLPRGAFAQAWSVAELLRAARKVGLK
ncbi:MAG: amylo-alpha-1,6-glucosidase [Thermoanaerobaculia bacterium]